MDKFTAGVTAEINPYSYNFRTNDVKHLYCAAKALDPNSTILFSLKPKYARLEERRWDHRKALWRPLQQTRFFAMLQLSFRNENKTIDQALEMMDIVLLNRKSLHLFG